MADDIGQSPVTQDTPQTTSSATPSISQPSDVPLANTPDPAWPISTKMANEDKKEASPAASISDSPFANNDSTPFPDLANQTATSSGQVIPSSEEPDSIIPADSTSEANPSANLANPSSPVDSPPPISPQLPQSPSSSTDNLPLPTLSSSPAVEPSQMQSSPSESASQSATISSPPDLANIQPEPSQSPQNLPLANEISPPTSSFGKILSKDQPKSSIIPPSSPNLSNISNQNVLPKTSFGDILADKPVFEPKINIEPIVPPSSPSASFSPTPSSAQSPQFPLSPLPAEASAKEGLSPSSSLLQKANQKRLDKRQKNLDKILLSIKETGTITNTDVQRLCRVSQSTATNYLTELEKKGLLKQQGFRGGAKYIL